MTSSKFTFVRYTLSWISQQLAIPFWAVGHLHLSLTSNVYTIERQQSLFKQTQRLFLQLGLRPKKQIFGDGYKGLPKIAPFDRIIVTAGAPEVPKSLMNQLAIGGKLIIPLGANTQIMTRFTRTSNLVFDKEEFGKFKFVPLLENKI